jgi:hypothetical protein
LLQQVATFIDALSRHAREEKRIGELSVERRLFGARELVRLGEQDEPTRVPHPLEELPIERRERMACVHDHHDAREGWAPPQVGIDELFPLVAQGLGGARESVARQVDQPRLRLVFLAQRVKIDGLRAAGRLAGKRKALAAEERVDCARLADVRAAGEGELRRAGRRDVAGPAGRGEKLCLREYSNKIAPFDDSGAWG